MANFGWRCPKKWTLHLDHLLGFPFASRTSRPEALHPGSFLKATNFMVTWSSSENEALHEEKWWYNWYNPKWCWWVVMFGKTQLWQRSTLIERQWGEPYLRRRAHNLQVTHPCVVHLGIFSSLDMGGLSNDKNKSELPPGNQTWQWKIPHKWRCS